ncbi:MAG: hypothetical protein DRO14_04205 [Thermoprotei archaeon]|nr:MAG: hypothetical protein DRO14_04205 [Thermoprotei archaeon]
MVLGAGSLASPAPHGGPVEPNAAEQVIEPPPIKHVKVLKHIVKPETASCGIDEGMHHGQLLAIW